MIYLAEKNTIQKVVKILNILVIAIFLSLVSVYESSALDNNEAQFYLWKLINQARANPQSVIEKYEIDINRAREALGDKYWIFDLEDGLPPLAWNNSLAQTSIDHNNDMIARSYYDYTSPDGISFYDRIVNIGYNPEITGESLGILSFNIYLEPQNAVETLFANMIRDELNPEFKSPKNIFSTDYTEIGVSFMGTVILLEEDRPLNIYIVTADFAKSFEPRSYILGTIYSINKELEEARLEHGEENKVNDNDPKVLLEIPGYEFSIYINYLDGKEVQFVPLGFLGSYQVQIPPYGYFMIQIYDEFGDLVKLILVMGSNRNQLLNIAIQRDKLPILDQQQSNLG